MVRNIKARVPGCIVVGPGMVALGVGLEGGGVRLSWRNAVGGGGGVISNWIIRF